MTAQQPGSNLFANDSLTSSDDSSSHKVIDTSVMKKSTAEPFYNSPLVTGGKPVWYDIERQREHKNDAWVFFVLLQLLVILTVLKLAFSNDLDNLLRSFLNSNIASQLGRSSKDDPRNYAQYPFTNKKHFFTNLPLVKKHFAFCNFPVNQFLYNNIDISLGDIFKQA